MQIEAAADVGGIPIQTIIVALVVVLILLYLYVYRPMRIRRDAAATAEALNATLTIPATPAAFSEGFRSRWSGKSRAEVGGQIGGLEATFGDVFDSAPGGKQVDPHVRLSIVLAYSTPDLRIDPGRSTRTDFDLDDPEFAANYQVGVSKGSPDAVRELLNADVRRALLQPHPGFRIDRIRIDCFAKGELSIDTKGGRITPEYAKALLAWATPIVEAFPPGLP